MRSKGGSVQDRVPLHRPNPDDHSQWSTEEPTRKPDHRGQEQEVVEVGQRRTLTMHQEVEPVAQIPQRPPIPTLEGEDLSDDAQVTPLEQHVVQEDLVVVKVDEAGLERDGVHREDGEDGQQQPTASGVLAHPEGGLGNSMPPKSTTA